MFFAGLTTAVGFACLVAAVFAYDANVPISLGFVAAALFSFFVHSQVKCPRCRLHVYGKEGFRKFGETLPQTCPRCGRNRKGVWPFQYALAPENGTTSALRSKGARVADAELVPAAAVPDQVLQRRRRENDAAEPRAGQCPSMANVTVRIGRQ